MSSAVLPATDGRLSSARCVASWSCGSTTGGALRFC
jgi:hypothetical protein